MWWFSTNIWTLWWIYLLFAHHFSMNWNPWFLPKAHKLWKCSVIAKIDTLNWQQGDFNTCVCTPNINGRHTPLSLGIGVRTVFMEIEIFHQTESNCQNILVQDLGWSTYVSKQLEGGGHTIWIKAKLHLSVSVHPCPCTRVH